MVDADREFAFRTRDVSEGGLFLCTRVGHLYPFRAGEELALELHHGEQVLVVSGIVVRVVSAGSEESARYPEGFGIAFGPLEPEQRALLRSLITSSADRGDPRSGARQA